MIKYMDTLPVKCNLIVYRDFIESNGKWRLFWENEGMDGIGVHDESTVTGKPFFDTMKEAINHGIIKYNIRATKKTW